MKSFLLLSIPFAAASQSTLISPEIPTDYHRAEDIEIDPIVFSGAKPSSALANVAARNDGSSSCTRGCPQDPDILGFPTFRDLQCAMSNDILTASTDSEYKGPFIYRLCPNTVYEIGQDRIEPILDDTQILCGLNASAKDNCVVSGGSFQSIVFAKPELNPRPVQKVTYQGITFANHEDGDGLSASLVVETGMVEIIDCHWVRGRGDVVILLQQPDTLRAPARVSITNSTFRDIKSQSTSVAPFAAFQSTSLVMTGVEISDVHAMNTGLFFAGSGTWLLLSDSTVSNITVAKSIMTCKSGVLLVEDSVISNCKSLIGTSALVQTSLAGHVGISSTKFVHNSAPLAFLSFIASRLTVTDSLIDGGNYSKSFAVADDATVILEQTNITTISSGSSLSHVLMYAREKGVIRMNSSVVSRVRMGGFVGAVVNQSLLELSNSMFHSNDVAANFFAVHGTPSIANLSNIEMRNNTAKNLLVSRDANQTVLIAGSSITNNTLEHALLTTETTSVSIDDTTMAANTARVLIQVIDDSDLHVHNITVARNSMQSSTIQGTDSHVQIEDLWLYENDQSVNDALRVAQLVFQNTEFDATNMTAKDNSYTTFLFLGSSSRGSLSRSRIIESESNLPDNSNDTKSLLVVRESSSIRINTTIFDSSSGVNVFVGDNSSASLEQSIFIVNTTSVPRSSRPNDYHVFAQPNSVLSLQQNCFFGGQDTQPIIVQQPISFQSSESYGRIITATSTNSARPNECPSILLVENKSSSECLPFDATACMANATLQNIGAAVATKDYFTLLFSPLVVINRDDDQSSPIKSGDGDGVLQPIDGNNNNVTMITNVSTTVPQINAPDNKTTTTTNNSITTGQSTGTINSTLAESNNTNNEAIMTPVPPAPSPASNPLANPASSSSETNGNPPLFVWPNQDLRGIIQRMMTMPRQYSSPMVMVADTVTPAKDYSLFGDDQIVWTPPIVVQSRSIGGRPPMTRLSPRRPRIGGRRRSLRGATYNDRS